MLHIGIRRYSMKERLGRDMMALVIVERLYIEDR